MTTLNRLVQDAGITAQAGSYTKKRLYLYGCNRFSFLKFCKNNIVSILGNTAERLGDDASVPSLLVARTQGNSNGFSLTKNLAKLKETAFL